MQILPFPLQILTKKLFGNMCFLKKSATLQGAFSVRVSHSIPLGSRFCPPADLLLHQLGQVPARSGTLQACPHLCLHTHLIYAFAGTWEMRSHHQKKGCESLPSSHWPERHINDERTVSQNLFTFKNKLNKTFHSSPQAEILNRPTRSTQILNISSTVVTLT